MARELDSIVKQLIAEGNIVYSFSKLGTKSQCDYAYFNSYIKHIKGIDNVYSISGHDIHGDLEKLYKGEDIDLNQSLNRTLSDLDMLNITFMNDKIKDAWIADMKHFCCNFKKPNGVFITEEGFIFEIMPHIYVQGYIDLIQKHDDGSISIIDFKTSSKFDKEKLKEAGRQLVLYGVAKEKEYKIKYIGWNMLKYLYVCWTLKNGKINKKMCNRSKWVKELGTDTKAKNKNGEYKITKSLLKRDLEALGYEEFEIDIIIADAINKNNIKNMPENIKNKYWLEDCLVEYDFNNDTKEALFNYIKDTHEDILSKNASDENDWKPRDIENDNFFCSNLCNHRKTCKYLLEYYEKLKLGETKEDNEFEELFG